MFNLRIHLDLSLHAFNKIIYLSENQIAKVTFTTQQNLKFMRGGGGGVSIFLRFSKISTCPQKVRQISGDSTGFCFCDLLAARDQLQTSSMILCLLKSLLV